MDIVPSPGAAHVPVLVAEVLELLAPAPGQTFVDATLGTAGHGRIVAERLGESGRLIGLDRDASLLDEASQALQAAGAKCRIDLVHSNFDRLREVLDDLAIKAVDGVLADLGFSSAQMDRPERGLSFQREGPLDMRLDPASSEPASALVNRLNERELADLFWRYGEERASRRVASAIVRQRRRTPFTTTTQLAEFVRRVVRPERRQRRFDPATRVFQALRIAVNDEVGSLQRLLAQLPDCVRTGGRVGIISFHSIEDRKVKHAFRNREHWKVITRKPVRAREEEMERNPRARSGKLRVAQRV
jgi:16S rRNA (cytosine1402-N4)-methyltransferase